MVHQIMMPLSSREQDVLEHLLKGHDNQTIAILLGLSSETIKRHIANMSKKMRVDSRFHITAYFYRERLKEASNARTVALNAVKRARSSVISFTPREHLVIGHLVSGKNCREVGCSLGLSTATVRRNLSQIAQKVGAKGRLGVLVYLHQQRLREVECERDDALAQLKQRQHRGDDQLTRREREIINHVIDGDGYLVIARRFGISVETVKHHIFNISKRAGLKGGRAEVAAFLYNSRLREIQAETNAALAKARLIECGDRF